MTGFYTNVKVWGNNILYRGFLNGQSVQQKIPYKPVLYIPIKEDSPYKTIYGENLKKIPQNSIREAKDFIKKYEGIDNFAVYGNTNYEYCLISELYPDHMEWDIENIRIAIIDIETNSDPDTGGFAKPEDPFQPIISIALKFLGEDKTYLFGYDDYEHSDVHYIKCKDEYTLCQKFLDVWSYKYPDIVSGWNIINYDIPYIINRFNRIISEQETNKLSPWKHISSRTNKVWNDAVKRFEENISYSLLGISILDYIDLYKRYQPGGNSQESYKLGHIAEEELGETKVEYAGSLHKLYTEDKDTFYRYNVQDVVLIEKLDNKCKLFMLGLTLAYRTKSNPEDIFQQTRMWDSLIYSFLQAKNIQVPQKSTREDAQYEGAYVKPPIPGLHKWIVTLDATSLYPSLLIGFNISPDTLVEPHDYTDDMKNIIQQGVSIEKLLTGEIDLTKLAENNVTLTPSGQFYRTDKTGFLAEMISTMFAERQAYKKEMLKYQAEYEKMKSMDCSAEDLLQMEYMIVKYQNLQNATKLSLNSAYGILGSKYFRFFDVRLAESITTAGQLSNKWVANNVNQYLNTLLNTDKDYIIMGDTDSIGITLNGLVEKVSDNTKSINSIIKFLLKTTTDKIQPEVDGYCNKLTTYLNCKENRLKYKLEKICSTGVFVAKKRYALNVYSNEGVVYAKPKLKVTGLEIVKSSTPKVVRTSLYDCLNLILQEDQEGLQRYVDKFKKDFVGMPLEQISFPRGVNGLNKYHDSTGLYKTGTPIHVRGSLLYNKMVLNKNLGAVYELIKEGDKMRFIYLKMPNPIAENVIGFPEKLPKEFGLHDWVDHDKMFETVFLKPLRSVSDVANMALEKKYTLDEFFV